MTQVQVNAPVIVSLGEVPCEGRKDFPFKLDFSTGLSQDIDFTQFYTQGTIKSIQGIFVNNRGNVAEILIEMSGTKQVIAIAPGAQAYLPVLAKDPPFINVSCTNGASVCFLHVLNFFVPPFMWNQTFTVAIASLDAIIVNGRLNVRTTPAAFAQETNRSGTIAVGGTGQVLMATNLSRLQWNLQNPVTATETLQFSKFTIAGPWYDLAPGAFASDSGSTIYPGTIWVLAATTGHSFTSDEGQ